MKRFLTTQTKRDVKKAFRSNALFQVINAAYKQQEVVREQIFSYLLETYKDNDLSF